MKKRKVLFLATYGDFLATFELSNIMIWQELGCEVHCASNFKNTEYNLKTKELDKIGVIKHQIEFTRSPMNIKNINEYRNLIKLMRKECFDAVDCHNAVVSVYARLAAKKCKIRRVIYTPHSFFFYDGCPIINNIVFKNVERIMAKYTDVLIAINKEDYLAAKSMRVRGKAIYVPGIGIDTDAIEKLPIEREKYCKELGMPENALIYISVGELIHRKDHETAIRAFAKANLENSYYIIAGIGELKNELQLLIQQLGMENKIKLLGYRLDVKNLMKACDVYLFPSLQEGLPVALMEAMACGLPCIATKIRGNVDLIDYGKGGYFFKPSGIEYLSRLIIKLSKSKMIRVQMGEYNKERIKAFDKKEVGCIMRKEYYNILNQYEKG